MHGNRFTAIFLVVAGALTLIGCAAPAAPTANTDAPLVGVVEAVVPPVVVVREAVQAAIPSVLKPQIEETDQYGNECRESTEVIATKLIVRWEVTGMATYKRKYEGVIWPGGASGPTWGIGYDGGHQTKRVIFTDWQKHGEADLLATTSGVVGLAAKQRVADREWARARTEYDFASEVFAKSTLPSYRAAARRALGPGFVSLPCGAQAALISVGYNRGWQMSGKRRVHMRTLRDECVPHQSTKCIADTLKAMCVLWSGTPNGVGLCSRRNDEARVARL